MKTEIVKIQKIKPNQTNPRYIRDFKFQKLVKSIKEFPEMLKLRPIVVDENMVVLGGNMRLKAILEAGIQEVPVSIAEGLTEDQKQEFIIKDNVSYGDWDWDVLANQWDTQTLDDWGMTINFGGDDYFDAEEKQKDSSERPMATDDDYSVFECVMLHDNKLRLIEGINTAKAQHGLEKTEDALILIVNKFLEQ
jgi:hypothetical protein